VSGRAIEIVRRVMVPEPRVLLLLSQAMQVSYDKLLLVAGQGAARDARLSNAAVRFVARSESLEKLTPQPEAALSEFMTTLAV
jgi:HTH-type transcriptional regulator, competence development regulator